jgi:hypothetical protein
MSRELKFKKMKNLRLIVLVNTMLLMATLTSCKKEPELPTIITSPGSKIGYDSANSQRISDWYGCECGDCGRYIKGEGGRSSKGSSGVT